MISLSKSLRVWLHSPLFWILLGAALLRATGLFWGLPGADGWDDDGVAPRNFLTGLAETYTPGHHFTYPPFHMFLLALPSLPVAIYAIAHAPSLHPQDVIATITQVPYMTYFAVVARLFSIAFSLGTIVVVGKIAEVLAGKRAGLFASAALALNAALVYYGVATNLDGPSLFWASLSLYFFIRLIALHELTAIRGAALSAMAAVATKDQTYALFLLSIPAGLALWFASDAWARRSVRPIFGMLAKWGVIALFALLLIDGALTNPHGFADRIAFLTGPASRDYELYQSGPAGWLALLGDGMRFSGRYYPLLAIALAAFGLFSAARREEGRAAALLPFLAIVSFTLTFNFVALRSEPRFFLPQSVFLAVYIGLGLEMLLKSRLKWTQHAVQAAAVLTAGLALFACAGISAAFLADPRYDAERFMAAHFRAGDQVEIYGLNAYLPRFPAGVLVTRVGPKPLKSRNPLPHVKEIKEAYGLVAARNPRYLVVPGFWVGDYLESNLTLPRTGRIVPKVGRATQLDVDARNYFGALFSGRLPYRLVRKSAYSAPLGPDINAYESLTQTVFIFERDPARTFEPVVTVPKSAETRRPEPLYGTLRPRYRFAEGNGGWPGLAFVSLGYHIEQTWGWDA